MTPSGCPPREALPLPEPQPREVPQVIQVDPIGHLALAQAPLQEHIAYLAYLADIASREHLDEDLVPERAHPAACDGGPPHHEIAAHRIRHPADHARQHEQPDRLRAAREEPPSQAPVAHAASLHMTA